jgi:hypothetical protein
MFSKTKMAVAAALVLGSAGAALADDNPYTAEKNAYLRNPNAPVPHFTQTAPVQAPRGLIEGRNVGVRAPAGIPSEQKRSFDRNAIDFNS